MIRWNMSPHSGPCDLVANKRPGSINLRSFPPLCPVTGTEMPLTVKAVCVWGGKYPKDDEKTQPKKEVG